MIAYVDVGFPRAIRDDRPPTANELLLKREEILSERE